MTWKRVRLMVKLSAYVEPVAVETHETPLRESAPSMSVGAAGARASRRSWCDGWRGLPEIEGV